MKIKTQHLKDPDEWTAFITVLGLDINTYGATESIAKERLMFKIYKDKNIQKAIKIEQTKP